MTTSRPTLPFILLFLFACGRLDREPPQLLASVTTPDPQRESLQLEVRALDQRPGLEGVSYAIDSGPDQPAPTDWKLDIQHLEDGTHTVTLTAIDHSWLRNRTTRTLTFQVDQTPPSLRVRPPPAAQGQTVAVWVQASEPLQHGEVHFLETTSPLYPVDDAYRALIGIDTSAQPGVHPLVVEGTDRAGNRARTDLTMTLEATEFARGGYIRLTRNQVDARRDQAAIDAMRAERDTAYAHPDPEQRWSGPMQLPLEGRVTSPFGKARRYSDGRTSHHSGLDLAHRRGHPVHAAADGQVLVAGEQAIFGKVVIVHHGQGVATSYNHLDALAVAQGDTVTAGTVVGTLGSTGQSTGPHLHWGLTVHGVAVDPAQWLQTGFDRP